MVDSSVLALLVRFLAVLATTLSPTPTPGVERCGVNSPTDSAAAAGYLRGVQFLLRHPSAPRAAARWVPADSSLCARADAAVRRHALTSDDARLFLFAVSDFGRTRYALVVKESPPVPGEWNGGAICFFDARWRKQGICVAY